MFNRSEIMKAAHAHRAFIRSIYADWQRRPGAGADDSMSACLKHAWQKAKEAARHEARNAAIAANPMAARIAAEIENVCYLPFGVSAENRRRKLEAQLNRLLAA